MQKKRSPLRPSKPVTDPLQPSATPSSHAATTESLAHVAHAVHAHRPAAVPQPTPPKQEKFEVDSELSQTEPQKSSQKSPRELADKNSNSSPTKRLPFQPTVPTSNNDKIQNSLSSVTSPTKKPPMQSPAKHTRKESKESNSKNDENANPSSQKSPEKNLRSRRSFGTPVSKVPLSQALTLQAQAQKSPFANRTNTTPSKAINPSPMKEVKESAGKKSAKKLNTIKDVAELFSPSDVHDALRGKMLNFDSVKVSKNMSKNLSEEGIEAYCHNGTNSMTMNMNNIVVAKAEVFHTNPALVNEINSKASNAAAFAVSNAAATEASSDNQEEEVKTYTTEELAQQITELKAKNLVSLFLL